MSDSVQSMCDCGRQERTDGEGQPILDLRWSSRNADSNGGRTDAAISNDGPGLFVLREAGPDFDDIPTDGGNNLLIQGDAREAMSALLQRTGTRDLYAGQVSLCYIDPPFNTGETYAQYDDSMDRRSWVEMMRRTLRQVRSFISDNGSIWVHLDDAAQHHGRCLLDEVFGTEAFVATVIWQKRKSRDNRKAFSSMHDYIHVYSPNGPKEWKTKRNLLPDPGNFKNPDNDPRGPWRSAPMSAQAGHATPSQFYTVVSPAGVAHDPPPGRCWAYTKENLERLDSEGRIYWPRNGRGKPRLKRYQSEVDGVVPLTVWLADEVGDNAVAKKDMLAHFPNGPLFDTPKPEQLLERIVHIATEPGDLVMDCFLGSGTTAAVAHKMGRQWLGIELSAETVATCTIPRLTAVVQGTDSIGITEATGWTGGGGFRVLKVDRAVHADNAAGVS